MKCLEKYITLHDQNLNQLQFYRDELEQVVATAAAVEGIHAEHGKDVMVADEATAFADAVAQVYEDATLWQTLADNGFANVRAHFSKDAAKANIQTLLQGLRD